MWCFQGVFKLFTELSVCFGTAFTADDFMLQTISRRRSYDVVCRRRHASECVHPQLLSARFLLQILLLVPSSSLHVSRLTRPKTWDCHELWKCHKLSIMISRSNGTASPCDCHRSPPPSDSPASCLVLTRTREKKHFHLPHAESTQCRIWGWHDSAQPFDACKKWNIHNKLFGANKNHSCLSWSTMYCH